jgi:Multicopper oxidase
MDGVPGLTQAPTPPGGVSTYEFTLHQSGTFFYHSHDGMRDGMGMVGLGNTVLVGVAQVREIEFIANNPGDWMLHCLSEPSALCSLGPWHDAYGPGDLAPPAVFGIAVVYRCHRRLGDLLLPVLFHDLQVRPGDRRFEPDVP